MREYTNEFTDEKILLKRTDVWHRSDEFRLIGLKDTTIYMHYRAWKEATCAFMYQCQLRNIEIIVVH